MVMQLWRVRKIVFGGLLFRRRVWEELEDWQRFWGEISESLDVWDLRSSAIALEKIFEIMLNLKVESILFLSIVIIVQFVLVPDCVVVEN
jgi:hypothetical protein